MTAPNRQVVRRRFRPPAGACLVAVQLALPPSFAVGCASGPEPTPDELREPRAIVVHQVRALERGDEFEAARWLTPEARAKAPLWPELAQRPSAESAHEVARSARWEGDSPIEVVRGAAGWQIRRGVLGLAHADSPERALDAFGRAIVARDWAMVLELVPADFKASWSAARLGDTLTTGTRAARWRELGEALAAARYTLDSASSERVKASVGVSGGATEVVVVRDGSGWKVFDVLPRSGYIAP